MARSGGVRHGRAGGHGVAVLVFCDGGWGFLVVARSCWLARGGRAGFLG